MHRNEKEGSTVFNYENVQPKKPSFRSLLEQVERRECVYEEIQVDVVGITWKRRTRGVGRNVLLHFIRGASRRKTDLGKSTPLFRL